MLKGGWPMPHTVSGVHHPAVPRACLLKPNTPSWVLLLISLSTTNFHPQLLSTGLCPLWTLLIPFAKRENRQVGYFSPWNLSLSPWHNGVPTPSPAALQTQHDLITSARRSHTACWACYAPPFPSRSRFSQAALEIQNMAMTKFNENCYKFPNLHAENQFSATKGNNLDLQNSSPDWGSWAAHSSFSIWVVLTGYERVNSTLLSFYPQASEGYRPLIYVFI